MENKKKLSKKLKIIITCVLILLIMVISIIFILINRLSMGNLIKGLKENTQISKCLRISNSNRDWENPLEGENVSIQRQEFTDARIINQKENYCVIYILDNEQYATLLKSYFDKILEIDKELYKQTYKANNLEDTTIHQAKNCIIYLNGKLGKKNMQYYIEQFDKIIKSSIHIEKNKIDSDEYNRLQELLINKAEIHKEKTIKLIQDINKQYADDFSKRLDSVALSLNEDALNTLSAEAKQLAKLDYFKELSVQWENKLDEIKNSIQKSKEDKATSISDELNNLSNSLDETRLTEIEKSINDITDSFYDSYKSSWESQIKEIKVKIDQKKINDYKFSCKSIAFKDISRNPDTYKGERVHFTGEIIQVIESYGYTSLRVNVTKQGNYYSYYTDTIYVIYSGSDTNNRLLENDIVDIYGELDGLYSYTSVMGATITLPKLTAKYIDLK